MIRNQTVLNKTQQAEIVRINLQSFFMVLSIRAQGAGAVLSVEKK